MSSCPTQEHGLYRIARYLLSWHAGGLALPGGVLPIVFGLLFVVWLLLSPPADGVRCSLTGTRALNSAATVARLSCSSGCLRQGSGPVLPGVMGELRSLPDTARQQLATLEGDT
jgi:hypothetical protein